MCAHFDFENKIFMHNRADAVFAITVVMSVLNTAVHGGLWLGVGKWEWIYQEVR